MDLKTALPFILDYYDREVLQMINQFSKTYEMLCNPELQMWNFSCFGIFDMWEAEQRTGDPRNSIYIQRC